ncbi:hypothetical protein KJZ67_00900 [Patescibacteria group bacterium]|nr:hypothetical protein [Patescibacteria group bacterium]
MNKTRPSIAVFFQKVVRQFGNPSLLYKRINDTRFPEKPILQILIWAKMRGLTTEFHDRKITYNLGSLYTLPHPIASDAYKKYISSNPGNLGSWSDKKGISSTQKIESEIIHKLIDLFHGKHNSVAGYVTSGGTEGNIFSVWLGRSYLQKKYPVRRICLLQTSLTHYSIRKAASICNIETYTIPLHPKKWNIDTDRIQATIKRLYDKGYRGFIIPVTIGYTSTGTSDDVELITQELIRIKKIYSDTDMYLWIDAALNGLVEPFINPSFHPFSYPLVHAIVLDFHKFGLVPFGAGIVLYKNTLRQYIEKPIDYLSETDTTLLGSRSGVPAISIWMMIHSLGKTGYTNLVRAQINNKNMLIKYVTGKSDSFEFITSDNSVSCGIIYNHNGKNRLPAWLETKYDLYPGKTKLQFSGSISKEKIIYKCFFLPFTKRRIVQEFAHDLLSLVR